ncbi:hypothetical protein B0T18DRAFT_440079 [Schizothecium vesticola]|uniref:DUF2828 domain-containing protein n=1 Tax=Schizothecium vesticola TaxID=314040 RepID=A0AA40EJA6_9PEZI|nr:hypothetical protein B0T18DRAFT_440079 [Schizothecium vesticola]
MANQDAQQQSEPDQPPGDISWFLKAKCPVFLPKSDALTLHAGEFEAFLRDSIRAVPDALEPKEQDTIITDIDMDVAGRLLIDAWAEDPDSTLKIIFNARSIHLGKGSRMLFYRYAGWLATNHPLTLLANMRWLVRLVIPKTAEKTTDEDDVMVETAATLRKLEMLDAKLSGGPDMVDELVLDAEHDVKNGVAHGYWKDLLNILALSAYGGLDVAASQRDILYMRHSKRRTRHETAVDLYTNNPLHRAIHLTVARLFAEQLQCDLAALAGDDKKAKRNISLCGKWAPSTDRFHDRHTFVVSSIAEIMFPESQLVEKGILSPSANDDDRTIYLRHARDSYRKAVAGLRKHLEVVGRDLSANILQNINYEHVPSLAMDRYVQTFAMKDPWRFEACLGRVASGRSRISRATLLPSTLVHKARRIPGTRFSRKRSRRKEGVRDMVNSLLPEMEAMALDRQWNTLVQRIKDSGTLPSCIAVCDVSRSMEYPTFRDGTCPLESAIGLSLLLTEVAEPPFRGAFITFSEVPSLKLIDLSATLKDKIRAIDDSYSSLNTDFEAVFTTLILPMAIENNMKQEDMVKRIFVLSDLHFDKARNQEDAWSTSHERIQKAYQEAGYEVPELVYWNLADGKGYYDTVKTGDEGGAVDPKPVTAEHAGVAMVSSYSQGMLKVFLDDGLFEKEEAEVVETVVEGEDGDELMELAVKKPKLDPLATVKKAISPKTYAMLKVVD